MIIYILLIVTLLMTTVVAVVIAVRKDGEAERAVYDALENHNLYLEAWEKLSNLQDAEEKEWERLRPFLLHVLDEVQLYGAKSFNFPAYIPLTQVKGEWVSGRVTDLHIGEPAVLHYEGGELTTSPVVRILRSENDSIEYVFIKTQSGSVYLVGKRHFE